MLSRELEEERERRVKAEKVASRLVEHIRSLQTQLEESRRECELAVVRVAKLDEELKRERERGEGREEEGRKVKEVLGRTQKELEAARERAAEGERRLGEKEEEISRRETQHRAEVTELVRRLDRALWFS